MSQDRENRRPKPEPLSSLPPAPTLQADLTNDSDDELSAWRTLQSGASTPNLTEAVESLKRSLSFSMIQEMSNKPSSEVRRNIQNKLWRPKDEEARIPNDWERLMVHVARAGARSFVLSYGLRSTMSFLFALIKMLRAKRKSKPTALKDAFLGEDTIRFALMFGLWSSLYKFVNNGLRLLTPFPKRHELQAPHRSKTPPASHEHSEGSNMLSISAGKHKHHPHKHHSKLHHYPHHHHHHHHKHHGKEGQNWKHLSNYDPRVRYWHPYVSGAISSIALLVERKSLVQSFGSQLFVRGLEGTYRFARSLGYIDIPYGSLWVFGIANMQIIWAWLSAPSLLPPSYMSWITKASDLSQPILDTYERGVNLTGPDPWALEKIFGGQLPEPISTNPLKYPDLPPNKYSPKGISGDVIAKMYRWAEQGNHKHFPTCAIAHAYSTNHFWVFFYNLFNRWKWVMPVYLTLYAVPTIFFRTKTLFRDPKGILTKIFLGASRSSAFLAVYIVLVKNIFCLFHESADAILYNPRLRKSKTAMTFSSILRNDKMKLIPGFLTSLALLVEVPHRRSELSAYVLPKALEAYWALARRLGIVPHIPYGDFWLASISISLIMGTYTHHPESLSRLVSLVIYQFLGRN